MPAASRIRMSPCRRVLLTLTFLFFRGFLVKAGDHWAFQPIVAPVLPVVPAGVGTVRTPVDVFIFSKLAEQGSGPAPEAERRVLIRRLSFDLKGLPPTREEIELFVNDNAPNAYG